MKITAKDLQKIICNCQLNKEPNDYLRDKIGSALCRVLYGNEFEEEYKELGDAGYYNCPSEEEIFKCFDYMEEHDMIEEELILNLD